MKGSDQRIRVQGVLYVLYRGENRRTMLQHSNKPPLRVLNKKKSLSYREKLQFTEPSKLFLKSDASVTLLTCWRGIYVGTDVDCLH